MIGNLIPLAVAAALYPTLLAIVVVILTRPHPARLLAAFLAGALLMASAVAVITLLVLKGTGAVQSSGSSRSVSPTVDLIAGALAITVGVAVWLGLDRRVRARRHRNAPSEKKQEGDAKPSFPRRLLERDSIVLAFVLGIVMDVPSAWYLLALKDVAAANDPTVSDVLVVAGFELVMFALLWIPLVLYLVAPDRSAAIVEGGTGWFRAHARPITIVVALGVGAFLVVKGLAGLL